MYKDDSGPLAVEIEELKREISAAQGAGSDKGARVALERIAIETIRIRHLLLELTNGGLGVGGMGVGPTTSPET